jgi:chromosome segregation ATPase
MQQLRRRLETIAEDTRYPRDDVLKLRAQVEAHEAAVEQHKELLRALDDRNGFLSAQLERQRLDLEQRMTALTRKFEESLDRLTDNRELIAGIKAFLRMIRGDGDPAAGADGP